MKAVVLEEYGSIENLALKEIPIPVPTKDQVLVKIHATSINPIDVKTRDGKGASKWSSIKPPFILGWDVSGTIESIGDAVVGFKKGDEVFGSIGFPGLGQTDAQYTVVSTEQLCLKPTQISHQQAAAAAMSGLTAWQALSRHIKIKTGDRILIHAASGGVGHMVVQIAKKMGAYVIGTSSSGNKEFVLSLGADEHYDYHNGSFEKNIEPVDFVFDAVGGETTIKSLDVLKTGGTLVSILPQVDQETENMAQEKGVNCFFSLMRSSGKDLQPIADMLSSGDIKVHICKQYTLENIGEAHIEMEKGHTVGKIVVNIV